MSIKKYIDKNRSQLNNAEPPADLWESIGPQIKAPPQKRFPYFWAAAIVLFAASISIIWQADFLKPNKEAQRQVLPSSFLSLEKNYSRDLDSLQSRIPLAELRQDPDLSWIVGELEALEKINTKYRADIGKGVPEEELVKVLIDYYEKRLHLLIRIERELKRKEKHHPYENINL